MQTLNHKSIAILATSGFEESELFEPREALINSGASVQIISLDKGRIRAWNHGEWSKELPVDKTVDEAKEEDYDALLIPGGVINPDKLRRQTEAVDFVKRFFEHNKPVASICHGPQMLIEAGVADGRKLTSFYSIKTDLINAGAEWMDKEVVVDNSLVTSRNPGDMDAFISKTIEVFSKSHRN
ncbi:type 1 glutamine amidotransferase domain-containing protein [Saccharicrinis sp. FJH54]|uniref:type 1 glutamine amidotransferase domain-containing protein n=1 Tax=Saccharicrinis sp. FJH54 TaxID=3344665 RepID=UPI0035D3F457